MMELVLYLVLAGAAEARLTAALKMVLLAVPGANIRLVAVVLAGLVVAPQEQELLELTTPLVAVTAAGEVAE